MRPQNLPRPNWPDCLDENGQQKQLGPYKLIKYLGYGRKDALSKCHHRYLVECVRCGRTGKRIQGSLMKAERSRTKGCVHCVKTRDKETDTDRKREKREEQRKRLKEWIHLMRSWPATSIEFRGGIDHEKMQELRKLRR